VKLMENDNEPLNGHVNIESVTETIRRIKNDIIKEREAKKAAETIEANLNEGEHE
jgi:hypothetical protein